MATDDRGGVAEFEVVELQPDAKCLLIYQGEGDLNDEDCAVIKEAWDRFLKSPGGTAAVVDGRQFRFVRRPQEITHKDVVALMHNVQDDVPLPPYNPEEDPMLPLVRHYATHCHCDTPRIVAGADGTSWCSSCDLKDCQLPHGGRPRWLVEGWVQAWSDLKKRRAALLHLTEDPPQ